MLDTLVSMCYSGFIKRKQGGFEMYQYKMECYRTEDNTLFIKDGSNNLEYFNKYKNKENYRIKIFQKVNNRWKIIYSEL